MVLREFSGASDFQVTFSHRRIRGGVGLDFRLAGELTALDPAPLPPVEVRSGQNLWKRSCLEAFFFDADSQRYVELNWTVVGEHALLAFESYRQPSDSRVPFEVMDIDRSQAASWLECRLDLRLPADRRFLLSPTAVLRPAAAPGLYFALAHGPRPDFHARNVVEGLALPVSVREVGEREGGGPGSDPGG